MNPEKNIERLRELLRQFAADRDWDQFHSPKNLAMALVAEAGELAEVFQWLTEADSKSLTPAQRSRAEEEMADVLLYLIRMADKLDVDLVAVALQKMVLNAHKYPIEKSRGHAKKYNE